MIFFFFLFKIWVPPSTHLSHSGMDRKAQNSQSVGCQSVMAHSSSGYLTLKGPIDCPIIPIFITIISADVVLTKPLS